MGMCPNQATPSWQCVRWGGPGHLKQAWDTASEEQSGEEEALADRGGVGEQQS